MAPFNDINAMRWLTAITRALNHLAYFPSWLTALHAGRAAIPPGAHGCVGNPNAVERWQWRCGFYPGSNPGDDSSGTAPTFEAAREAFEAAWRDYLPKRSEADFQAWRDQRDCTAEKYRRFDRGERMPADWRRHG
jgi:hypothetical protein